MGKIGLLDIVDKAQWQKIQDHFAKVLGVTLRTIDVNDNFLTTPTEISRVCREVIHSSRLGIAMCGKCLPPFLKRQGINTLWKEGYQCHMKFHLFCIPVEMFNKEPIAYILLGPVFLGKRPHYEDYIEKVRELGIDFSKFVDALLEIKVFSFYGIRSVIELLHNVASYIAQLGYQKLELKEIASLSKIERFVGKFYVDKLLNTLLDISFEMLGAEIGSVMLWDKEKEELYIRVSRGLKEEIAKNVRLKIGEGIAGVVAQEKKSFFVDDKIEDTRIKNRLTRRQIKSAIITPLKSKDKILGVVNIATQKRSEIFSSSHTSLLEQLAKLVSVALEDIYQ